MIAKEREAACWGPNTLKNLVLLNGTEGQNEKTRNPAKDQTAKAANRPSTVYAQWWDTT